MSEDILHRWGEFLLGVASTLAFQCRSCAERYGPLLGQAGIRPEHAAGIYASSGIRGEE